MKTCTRCGGQRKQLCSYPEAKRHNICRKCLMELKALMHQMKYDPPHGYKHLEK